MILYLETSTLVKLHVEEEGSAQVRELVAGATSVASSLISYAEVRAALARRFRLGDLTAATYGDALTHFREDWRQYVVTEVSPALVERAGDYAEKHRLRALDAIHLASAVLLREGSGSPIRFSSADQRLCEAARQEGFAVA